MCFVESFERGCDDRCRLRAESRPLRRATSAGSTLSARRSRWLLGSSDSWVEVIFWFNFSYLRAKAEPPVWREERSPKLLIFSAPGRAGRLELPLQLQPELQPGRHRQLRKIDGRFIRNPAMSAQLRCAGPCQHGRRHQPRKAGTPDPSLNLSWINMRGGCNSK